MADGKATKAGDWKAMARLAGVLALFAAVAALAALELDGATAAVSAVAVTVAAGAAGVALGRDWQASTTRLRLYRVADELAQYRVFTQLMRSQHDRIAELSEDAAMTIAEGLRDIDDRAGRLAARLDGDDRGEAAAIAGPVTAMVGKLQFQDVTRQQLAFLSRLSLLLDDHMAELARMLGDRRALDRTTRFKELFDRALDDTVMTSQRNDHHRAGGVAVFEAAGPAVELFAEEEGGG